MNTLHQNQRIAHACHYQGGQVVMAAVMVFLTLSLVVVIGISSPIAAQIKNTSVALETRQNIGLTDSVSDDLLYRLNSGRSIPSTMVLSLNMSTSTATVSDVSGSKQIIVSGLSGRTERAMRTVFSQGDAIAISYGAHVGNGGLQMSGGPTIFGNAFSNGSISASGGSTITGSASAASSLSAVPFIENASGASPTPASTVVVGQANNIQRIAQSFAVPTNVTITAFSFYMKKTGAPGNATIKIYNNSGGSVGTTQIGSTGSLNASAVTSSYDWIEVYPTAPITLNANTNYWLTFEWQGTNANYYTLVSNVDAYSDGQLKTKSKTGTTWGSYVDAVPAGKDILFSMTTGTLGSITGVNINGSANAGIINNSTAGGSMFCQTGTGNNKACNPSQPLPVPVDMPVSAAMIQAWKNEASAGAIRNSSWDIGNNTSTTTGGAMKIVGNLKVRDGATLTVAGPLYVTGSFSVEGGGTVRLAGSYGTGDEVIVSSTFKMSGGGSLSGSGQAGSYVTLVADGVDNGSTYTGQAEGGSSSVVFIVPNGTIKLSGGASAKAAVAYKIIMEGGATLVYEAGLASLSFTNGSSLGWNVQSWKEIEQ